MEHISTEKKHTIVLTDHELKVIVAALGRQSDESMYAELQRCFGESFSEYVVHSALYEELLAISGMVCVSD